MRAPKNPVKQDAYCITGPVPANDDAASAAREVVRIFYAQGRFSYRKEPKGHFFATPEALRVVLRSGSGIDHH